MVVEKWVYIYYISAPDPEIVKGIKSVIVIMFLAIGNIF